jgi:hypothetical protein
MVVYAHNPPPRPGSIIVVAPQLWGKHYDLSLNALLMNGHREMVEVSIDFALDCAPIAETIMTIYRNTWSSRRKREGNQKSYN